MRASRGAPTLRRTSIVALLAAACGKAPNGSPDGGGPPAPADAYFGLAERRCWEYAVGNGGTYSVEAVGIDTTTVPGARTYRMLHRLNGLPQKTEFLEPTATDLRLRQRVFPEGASDRVHAFDPAPVLLRHPTARGDHVVTESTRTERVPGESPTTAPVKTTLDVAGEGAATVPAGAFATFSGTLRTDADGTAQLDRFNFAPEQGLVKLDPHGSDLDDLQLSAVKTLEAADLCGAE